MNSIQFQQRNRNFNDSDMKTFLHYFLSRLWDSPIVCHISHPIQYILKFLFYLPIIRWNKIFNIPIHEKYSFMRKEFKEYEAVLKIWLMSTTVISHWTQNQ